MGSVGSTSLLLCLIDLDMWNVEGINIQPFHLKWNNYNLSVWKQLAEIRHSKANKDIGHTSALLSAFLSKSRMNLADLTGHRPCPLECLFFAWAVLPTPRQNRLKGMACLWARTSSKYLLAFTKGNFLMAWAVSLVFCKGNLKGKNREITGRMWTK